MKTTQMHDNLKFKSVIKFNSVNSVNSGSPFYYINNNLSLFSDPKMSITVPSPALH